MPVTDRDQAYARIQEMIDDGTLVPEQPLSERGLAETLGLGRTPVREALRALARDRLLEVVPTRGTFVRTPTLDEMRETYEIRVALEGMAAYLAAERGPSPRLLACGERLRELLARAEKDVKVIQAVGWELHDEIFRCAGNRGLAEMHQTCRLRIGLALRLTRQYDHQRVHETIHEHLAVLEAIEAGEPEQAEQRMRQHLANALQARLRIFTRLGTGIPAPGGREGALP
jgi:DNA-binding GntR family transcriptional regulator